VILWKPEFEILQINFYSGQERLAEVGRSDAYVKYRGSRVESFEIADDESLIGCKLYEDDKKLLAGLTWMKIKMPKVR